MNILAGSFVTKKPVKISNVSFQRIDSPLEYNKKAQAIVLKSLSSKYVLLLGSVELIVARYGSPLSHLAIVAREHGIPVFITTSEIDSLPTTGKFNVTEEGLEYA